jgi:hypothetical protein
MQLVKFLQRRFPKQKGSIRIVVMLLSCGLLLLGVGLMFLQ